MRNLCPRELVVEIRIHVIKPLTVVEVLGKTGLSPDNADLLQLKSRIQAIQEKVSVDEDYESRITRIKSLIDERNANPNRYDDTIVRQMVECIKVYHDGRIEIIFGGGYTIEEALEVA